MRVLIAPDKFKGTLTAQAAAEAIARGWCRERPRDALELSPMTDGGDGFGEVISQLLGATRRLARTVDAAGRPCLAAWWWDPVSRTAVVESARVVGLAMLPAGRFHPFDLDTTGLGLVLRAAARAGARRCMIGLGGSATCDAGFGMARALGWRFLDGAGRSIERWTGLGRLKQVQKPAHSCWFAESVVAVDVQNTLLGRRGTTRIYGPQKGLRPRDFTLTERCLSALGRVVRRELGADLTRVPGSGSAGGLGFGLHVFLGARLEPGFALFARLASLEKRLRAADLVITGEGTIDASSFMGKGAGEIAARCRELRKPCYGLAGVLASPAAARRQFTQAYALTEMASLAEAKARPGFWLERLARGAARAGPMRMTNDEGRMTKA
ncbi:MAG TPA: glycerate kinase [Candidatus Acidoferrum sp.]|nr:glycerate kinase [Candidatus Acidoferrum sp.]